jgi:hypothetical protein
MNQIIVYHSNHDIKETRWNEEMKINIRLTNDTICVGYEESTLRCMESMSCKKFQQKEKSIRNFLTPKVANWPTSIYSLLLYRWGSNKMKVIPSVKVFAESLGMSENCNSESLVDSFFLAQNLSFKLRRNQIKTNCNSFEMIRDVFRDLLQCSQTCSILQNRPCFCIKHVNYNKGVGVDVFLWSYCFQHTNFLFDYP